MTCIFMFLVNFVLFYVRQFGLILPEHATKLGLGQSIISRMVELDFYKQPTTKHYFVPLVWNYFV